MLWNIKHRTGFPVHCFDKRKFLSDLDQAMLDTFPMDRVSNKITPVKQGDIKSAISEIIGVDWFQEFRLLDQCRQTKVWFPTPNHELAEEILSLSRYKMSCLVMFFSGHGPFNYQLNKMGLTDTRDCRFCGVEYETPEHLYFDCKGLEDDMVPRNPIWDIKSVLDFTDSMVLSGLFKSQEQSVTVVAPKSRN